LFLFPFCIGVSAVTLEKDTLIIPGGSNTVYTLGTDFTITSLKVENTTPYFNNNIFHIEPQGGTATVTIHSLNSMSFTVTATEKVHFILGGFNAKKTHEIWIDNAKWKTFITNNNGIISFSYDTWSTHRFSITETSVATGLFYITNTAITLFFLLITVLIICIILIMLMGGDATIIFTMSILLGVISAMCFILVVFASSFSNL